MGSDQKWTPYLEAIKLLKEWSTALVVIQTGALAVLGGLVKDGNVTNPTSWLASSLGFFLASILVAAHVIGAIPLIVQHLPQLAERHGDIYTKCGTFSGYPYGFLHFWSTSFL